MHRVRHLGAFNFVQFVHLFFGIPKGLEVDLNFADNAQAVSALENNVQ